MIGSESQMNVSPDYAFPVVDSILHPSEFSAGSLTAFHHALKGAIIAKSKLTVLHLSPKSTAAWTEFPGVRETLEQWGLLPPGSAKSAVPQLGIEIRKAVTRDPNGFLDALRGSHSERVLRTAPCPLLTVPEGSLAGAASQ